MIAHNDITGDLLRTKGSNDAYRSGWDRIFGKKEEPVKVEPVVVKDKSAEQDAADALRQEWWSYCEKNNASFTAPFPGGNLIPTFEEWRALAGR